MVVRATAKRPVIFSFAFLDRKIIDARDPQAHQAVLVEDLLGYTSLDPQRARRIGLLAGEPGERGDGRRSGQRSTMAQLARDCGLSAGHFARASRQSTGYPPHRWLLRRRIERAQDLLLTSDKTLAEIASACGYSNQSHLTRAFGQAVGISPGLWRRAKRA
jgi:AraC-like DNA-binding protein